MTDERFFAIVRVFPAASAALAGTVSLTNGHPALAALGYGFTAGFGYAWITEAIRTYGKRSPR